MKTTALTNEGTDVSLISIRLNIFYYCGYRYFAIEPYAATLEQFCNGQYAGPMPSDAQVLSQIAKGINFLHTKGFAHGNLNPQTVLIGQLQPVRMKVEFCHSPANENSTETKQNSTKKGPVILSLKFTG